MEIQLNLAVGEPTYSDEFQEEAYWTNLRTQRYTWTFDHEFSNLDVYRQRAELHVAIDKMFTKIIQELG